MLAQSTTQKDVQWLTTAVSDKWEFSLYFGVFENIYYMRTLYIQQYRLCHDALAVRGRSKEIFSQIQTLLAERRSEVRKSTKRHTIRNTGDICSVLLQRVHVYTTLFRLRIQKAQYRLSPTTQNTQKFNGYFTALNQLITAFTMNSHLIVITSLIFFLLKIKLILKTINFITFFLLRFH